MPKQRMHAGLVALSASAIAAIYTAGYVRTQQADAVIESEADAAEALPTPTTASAAPTPTAASRTLAPPTPAPTLAPRPAAPTAPQPQLATYKDGTYTGQGSSRRGDVWVSVSVENGRVTSVNITRSTLQYPLRDIAGLPDQVVQRQSPQVDIVSRATYSSQAFRSAVSQALSKAV